MTNTPPATLHLGDCIEVMRTLPENSVDAIVTDPPYGLGFMGKAWDELPPGEEWARECLRVLKPGGHLLAFGGTRTWHRLAVAIEDAGFEVRDSIAWMHGQGFPKGKATLKPAHEPIVVARKKPAAPRTGLLNIDACRVEHDAKSAAWVEKWSGHDGHPDDSVTHGKGIGNMFGGSPKGRWPANVVLDESQAAALDQQSGVLNVVKPYRHATGAASGIYGNGATDRAAGSQINAYGDKGGASRFFYVAKAPTSERPKVDGIAHPTVKPLALMRWLVRLVTPPGGTVLEPFAGSGTTVEACALEGFACIAIEREPDYLPLIQARLARVEAAQPEPVGPSLFDMEETA